MTVCSGPADIVSVWHFDDDEPQADQTNTALTWLDLALHRDLGSP